ncbi:hypothetical protein [Rhizobacter sp. SG703]|uniref:hypothetical protein n=1 Tax=Rhizobacter sp. SG703 TaxID=2587140 RepID=UPI001447EE7B|nr:hypothetical protein [Rhizobacter sp. SG703]NKI93433.1 hypothetical protein [Rhizobacter sp. SG703]
MQTRLFTDNADFDEAGDGASFVRELMESIRRQGPDGVRLSFGVEGRDRQLYCIIDTRNMVEAVDILSAARQWGMSIMPGRKEGGVWLHRIIRCARPAQNESTEKENPGESHCC